MAAKQLDFDIPGNNAIVGNSTPLMPWLQWFQRIQNIVGVRQIWRDMLSQRALGVTYVNGTGRPIKINVRAISTLQDRLDVTMGNGVLVSGCAQATIGLNMNVYAEIPNGESYTVQMSGGVGTLSQWSELR